METVVNSYVEYLLSNKVEKILNAGKKKEDKLLMILGDIAAFIIQNMSKAEENIDALIMSYKKINQEEVDEMDIDEYLSTLKNIFMAGVPKIIGDYVNLTEIKKKIKSINKLEQEN